MTGDPYDFGPPPLTDEEIEAGDRAIADYDALPQRHGMRLVRPNDDTSLPSVKEAIPDAPVDSRHVIPQGWDLSDEYPGRPALAQRTRKDDHVSLQPVSPSPFVLSAWVDNQTTRQKQLEVSWKGGGKWRSRVIDRSKIERSKIILAMADHGAPINGDNAAQIVKYLSAYERENKSHLPVRHVVEQCGWHDGEFVLGRWSTGGDVTFRGADTGDDQLADALGTEGTSARWVQAAELVHKYPRCEIALHAAFAAPLLEIVGCPNFAIEWSGVTSIGKTTALRVAASVYGCPNEMQAPSFVATWAATKVWLERGPSVYSGLPLCLDETMRAPKKLAVPDAVYDIIQGRGKGRGSISGTQGTRHWRTILLSTGEDRIVDIHGGGGGVAARILSIWGSPFGRASQTDDVTTINALVCANYGQAGRAWVTWLSKHRSEWPTFKKRFEELRDRYMFDDMGKVLPGVASRIAGYLAILELAGQLSHAALRLPWDYESCVDELLHELRQSPQEADRAKGALEYIIDWAASRRGAFWSAQSTSPVEPHGGWLGRWDRDTASKKWDSIGILPHHLHKALHDAGYDAKSVVRTWGDRGWLLTTQGRSTRSERLDGEAVRIVCVSRRVIDGEPEQMTIEGGK